MEQHETADQGSITPGTVVVDQSELAAHGIYPEKASRRRRRRRPLWVIVRMVLLAGVAVGIHAYVLQVFVVPSGSMSTTIHTGDSILVNKLWYDFASIEPGDVIVFNAPANVGQVCGGTQPRYLVKRVVAIAGQSIQSEGNEILVDGKPLAQPWLPASGTALGKAIPVTTVPAGDVYVLGDNRSESCDSRYWGPVSDSAVVGAAVDVVWPKIDWRGL